MPRVDGRRERISPPPELPDRARSLWLETVGDCRPEHFVPSDAPLLATYCAALAEREAADRHPDEEGRVLAGGKLNPWIGVRREALKTIGMLSMRLRLCPQSRQHKAQTSEGPVMSVYERMRLNGDDDDADEFAGT